MIFNDDYVCFGNMSNDVINFYTTSSDSYNLNIMNKEEAQLKVSNFLKKNNFNVKRFVYGHQEHTTNVSIVDESNIDDNFLNTDGLVTKLSNVGLISYSADCQTILLYDPVKKIIGNIHSGWKGTLNRIIVNGIDKFIELGSNVSDIEVYICPSILCFEVDEELVNEFKSKFSNIDNYISLGDIVDNKQKYYIDTVGINKMVLNELGVTKITNADICTKCDERFHSYRREKNNLRNMGFIMLK